MGHISVVVEEPGPAESFSQIQRRALRFLKQGIAVWLLFPDENIIVVYRPNTILATFENREEITTDDVPPGCRLRVADYFASAREHIAADSQTP